MGVVLGELGQSTIESLWLNIYGGVYWTFWNLYVTVVWYSILKFTFLSSAADDIPHADEVRTLIKDIWDLRIAKLRKSIDIMVSQQEVYARVCMPFNIVGLTNSSVNPSCFTHCKSSIAIIHLSNRLPPFQGKKVIKPPSLLYPHLYPPYS